MNIQQALLQEKVQSKEQALKIALYCSGAPDRLEELMECFFSADHRLAQRAAWSVSLIATKHYSLLQPYLETLAAQLTRTDVHDAIIRNSLRILQQLEIPAHLHGEAMHACFSLIESNEAAVAIKAFALTVLHKLSNHYPEILPELRLLIEERWPHESAAFRNRAKHILGASKT